MAQEGLVEEEEEEFKLNFPSILIQIYFFIPSF
jgi:hypothetical protein